MQDQDNNPTPEPVKPDLKHDSMEYAASTEGDDILDSDKESPLEIEEEDITAEELTLLEEDNVENQAEALNNAETDSQADEDNFLNEQKSEEDFEDGDEEKEEYERK